MILSDSWFSHLKTIPDSWQLAVSQLEECRCKQKYEGIRTHIKKAVGNIVVLVEMAFCQEGWKRGFSYFPISNCRES